MVMEKENNMRENERISDVEYENTARKPPYRRQEAEGRVERRKEEGKKFVRIKR